MKIYALQIHNNSTNEMDENYLFGSFEEMRLEFENKFRYLRTATVGVEMLGEKYPEIDSDGKVSDSGFCFGMADGSLTFGKCCDYDVSTED